MITEKKILIVKIKKPIEGTINDDLKWLGHSLGLFGERDRDKSCFRLFIELLKASKLGVSLSSDELAQQSNLSRGTVIHHLNRLMETGIVVPARKKYTLREIYLEQLMEDLKRDMDNAFQEIKKTAREIDFMLEMK